jgi:hypothetical protein
MDFSKLRRGELIAGVSAVALFIFMFFSWFGVPGVNKAVEQARQFGIPTVGNIDATANAWQSFDFVDIVLFVTVIAAAGMAALRASDNRLNLPLSISAIVAGLGALSTLLVLYRVVNPVGNPDLDRKSGLFLGLIAAAGVAYGGYRTMQDEGIKLAEVRDKLLGTTQTGPPEPPF